MSDYTVLCPFCAGVTDGVVPAGGKVCGALAKGVASENIPRTECLGLKGFVERVEARLQFIEAAIKGITR